MYYFASDIHLGLDGQMPSAERERLLVRWLDEVSEDADAIFLVGDVFDFWFEYKRVVPKGFVRLLGKLAELTDKGVKIHFFTGNHDMWTYDYLKQECGLIIHYKAEVFELAGKKLFVAHGDNMYIRKPFMERLMQAGFRSRTLIKIFSAIVHPNLAMRFGHWWSEKSRKSHSKTHVFRGEKEYLIEYARAYQACVKTVNVDYFVFGHMHCPQIYDMGEGHQAIFLGEWIYAPTYAVLDNNGVMHLRNYN